LIIIELISNCDTKICSLSRKDWIDATGYRLVNISGKLPRKFTAREEKWKMAVKLWK